MSVFIIAALSADGFIASFPGEPALWTSKADKRFFTEKTKQAGVVVMGRLTFETIGHPLKDRLNVVYSKTKSAQIQEKPGILEMTSKPPLDLVEELKSRGYKNIAICGGQSIYTMFLKAGAVDKLFLTVEPVLFGQGVSLFGQPFKNKLIFKSAKNIGDGAVVLEYEMPQEQV